MATLLSKESFLLLLPKLGFAKNGDIFSKSIGAAVLAVDPAKQLLIYPEDQGLVVNERQTCNFSAPENFVVFECVHRLLEKGYQARHVELEPKWKLGHGASGGRADILVKDNSGKAILIIECKTWGREFDRAWSETQQDGDQLFSYAQQISEVQFLCLYSATVEDDGAHVYQSHVIAHRDNDKYLEENKLKGFREATDVRARYGIWRDTYKLDFTTTGIFEPNIQPYHIGKAKLTTSDLKPITDSDRQKKYHEFATILRQHNVSGRENAFDKLVNLFLCKLVDEMENPDDLKFYWRGVAYDTHFDLLDRLQQLYQKGMEKFLGEEITYINEADVKKALRFYRRKPDATQRAVWKLFRRQKFFTNNDFSFIEVHNEKLFFQNADVLLKLLQMWHGIRLLDDSKHNQFLGDLFEGFLDQGVKQSEGQFFTPLPICRFLLRSLPLETLVKERATPPKAIDYACGAAHFLTELALQLKPWVAKHHPKKADMAPYHQAIVGIEKEYRLSKIAKVSAFMYQQPGIHICYGDALVHSHENYPEIANGTFDLLVANPPFSVRGFLETLPDQERLRYRLTETISDLDTADAIETFFVERAAQLLAPGGTAAIILPAGILSKGGASYVRAREILLQSFDVVAIAELGSGTFGKTGTNTVALFLRRKANNPEPAEHFQERVAEWFSGRRNDRRKQVVYRDGHLLDEYAAHIGVDVADYKTLLCGEPNESLLKHSTFRVYRKSFDESTDLRNLRKKKWFDELAPANQQKELAKRFLVFAITVEKDKLLHFILAAGQPNNVLILRCPTDSKEQKKLLGYDWSATKGNEGIKIIEDGDGHHLTALYDPTNPDNPAKVSHAIALNFDGKLQDIDPALEDYLALTPLVKLLDFMGTGFGKQIALGLRRTVNVQSKWTVVPLEEAAALNPEKDDLQKLATGTLVSFVEMASVSEQGYIASARDRSIDELRGGSFTVFKNGDVIIAKITPCMENGKCALAGGLKNGIGIGSTEFHVIRANAAKVLPGYLLAYLNRETIRSVAAENMTGSSGHRRVPSWFYAGLPLPLPPLDTQKKIVVECEAIEKSARAAQTRLDKARAEIARLVNNIYASDAPRREIDSVSLKVQYGLSEKMNEGGVGYKIFRMNEIAHGRMVDNGAMKYAAITPEEFTALKLHLGDVLFNRSNGSYDHVGKVGMFDLDGDYCFASYLVRIVPDTKQVVPLYLTYMMNANAFRDELRSKAVKSAGQLNINATKMRTSKVPIAPLAEQQRMVQAIEALEAKIAEADAVIAATAADKESILKKYL